MKKWKKYIRLVGIIIGILGIINSINLLYLIESFDNLNLQMDEITNKFNTDDVPNINNKLKFNNYFIHWSTIGGIGGIILYFFYIIFSINFVGNNINSFIYFYIISFSVIIFKFLNFYFISIGVIEGNYYQVKLYSSDIMMITFTFLLMLLAFLGQRKLLFKEL